MKKASPQSAPPADRTAPAGDPRVLVFACNWCSYAGADTAGVSRLQQSPHFRLLRVMCSGRVHPAHVLHAFAQGADGVMVSGCHFGDCHYIFGNYRAAEQFERTKALVDLLGLGRGRLRLEWISAAEGVRFAETMNEFVEDVRRAGPSPVAPEDGGTSAGSAGALRTSAAVQEAALRDESVAASTLRESGAFACLECGRCTAVCPVARHQRFSPRHLITRALSPMGGALAGDPALWTCLTCYGCQSICPVRVDYGRFILSARARAVAADPAAHRVVPELPLAGEGDGKNGRAREHPPLSASVAAGPSAAVPCSHGGVFREISLISSRPGLRQNRLAWLEEREAVEVVAEGARAAAEDLFFVGCSPYFAAYFAGETGAGLIASLRASLRLLARAGIRPALLANERCCGHHLRLAGQTADGERLERAVAAQIAASGAKRVIAYCPECMVALREICARQRVACTVGHLSQVLGAERQALIAQTARAEAAPESAAGAGGPEPAAGPAGAGRVTYQDPCRLGRYVGVYDRPRQLLTEVAEVELVEMPRHGEQAVCCGNTGWLNCNAATKRFQIERLEEAAATGSARLVTACPGCFIHLRCAQEGLPDGPAAKLRICDLWSVVAERTCASVAAVCGPSAGGRAEA